MKNVSTLAPASMAAEEIRKEYAGLVAPELLRKWTADPAKAPGRRVSSPWPARIDVDKISTPSPDSAVVEGSVVEMTSAGEAAREPVEIALENSGHGWWITSVAQSTISPDQQGAVDVIEHYYRAIAARDFASAYADWESGLPNQSLQQFAAGFADTASVRADTGTPSRVEGAAGSRYVDVPVAVQSMDENRVVQRFTGTYTLRRTAVTGASESQQRWHIYRASMHSVEK